MNKPLAFADCTRTADARPASWDAASLTFEAVVATPHPVSRRDAKGPFLEVLTASTLTEDPQRDLPVYDGHRGGTARDTIGVVQSRRMEGEAVVALIRLSSADDVRPIRQRVAEGTIRHTSVGYRVAGWTESRDAEGNRVKTPIAWTLTEISLVPNPADPNARIRSEKASTAPARVDGIPCNNRAASNGDVMQTDEITADRAEIERRSEIRSLCRSAGLADDATDRLIDSGATLADAKAVAFDHMQTRSRTAPSIRTHAPANDAPATLVRRQADALAVRMAGGECPEDARQHVAESMLDMARSALSRAGVSTRGMSADETFARAAQHGTSDFPLIVQNAANKVALASYQAAQSPLKTLCRQRTLPNFKPSSSIRVGEMGRLEQIAESGEITHTSRAEAAETMRLKTYARGITVSRNLMIDDDLGMLGDMTRAFGEAAAQTEADILTSLVLENPSLSDGMPVFDASRGNLADFGIPLGAAGDQSAIGAARRAMRGFTGLDGKTLINVQPRYLVVGPESETAAEQLLGSIYAATTSDVNPFAGKLTLMVEPRITDDRWFLFADPGRMPCLQYAYLSSAQGVQIQRTEAWDTLGMKFRAFLDFGAGWLDWRGAYLNEGNT
jgi:hypothetical protein